MLTNKNSFLFLFFYFHANEFASAARYPAESSSSSSSLSASRSVSLESFKDVPDIPETEQFKIFYQILQSLIEKGFDVTALEMKEIADGAGSRIYSIASDETLVLRKSKDSWSESDTPSMEKKADEQIVMLAKEDPRLRDYFNIPIILEINDQTNHHYYSLLQYMPLGSLKDRTQGSTSLDRIKDAIGIGFHLLKGLDLLHARNFAHRDIKPENILFSAMGIPKFIDFGELSSLSFQEAIETGRGTPYFLPPDLFKKEDYHYCTINEAQSHDIYALGLSLYLYVYDSIYPSYFYKDLEKKELLLLNQLADIQREKASKISIYKDLAKGLAMYREKNIVFTDDLWIFQAIKAIEALFHPTTRPTAREALELFENLEALTPQ